MTSSMPRVRFGDVLRPNLRPRTLAFDQDANLVGMRWYGLGPFHRELKPAEKIQKKSHFLIKAGDAIYNKLFAWKGAFGVVPDELDGMYVSDKFPTYELDRSRIDPRYLAWYFRQSDVWDQALKKSTGSAAISKLTLNPPQFLELHLPLPGIDKQKAIATQLDAHAERIREAKMLRAASASQAGHIIQGAANALLARYDANSTLGAVLLRLPRNGWSPKCDNVDGGTPVLTLTAVTGWVYNAAAIKHTSLPTVADAHYWLQKGDLLITRSNTPELVGHVAIYDGHPHPCIYPDLIMKLTVDPAKVSAKFAWWWMQTTRVRDYVIRNAKGSSPTMKKISQSIVAGIPFPSSISLHQQESVVQELDALQTKVLALKTLQNKTDVELEAMLPAILNQAFSGKL
jgi:type I restriction enzyme, S subunit